MKLARALGAIGRTMITLGVLILLFVAYQLWGTGIREAQAQNRLGKQFNNANFPTTQAKSSDEDPPTVESGGDGDAPAVTASTATSVAPDAQAPPEGQLLGKIEIPKIGLSAYVVEGIEVDDLKNGPGHYPGTPLPGEKGNAAIAGHRSTYGAPFANIDELNPNDPSFNPNDPNNQITVTTLQGVFHYKVTGQEIVSPSDVAVLDPTPDNQLTLTACHPKYSASKRIVIHAVLMDTPAPTVTPAPATPTPAANLDSNVSGKGAPKLPVLFYGLLCAAIWFGAWVLAKRWRKWPAYLIGLPFFLVALFYFFENFSRLLPANY